jgi:hypothetical protein
MRVVRGAAVVDRGVEAPVGVDAGEAEDGGAEEMRSAGDGAAVGLVATAFTLSSAWSRPLARG